MAVIIVMIILLFLGLTYAGVYYPYVLLRPYLKSPTGRSKVLKGALILFLSGLFLSLLIRYLMREPQYFEQGIEQLHNNKYIEDSIGGFNSYTYDGNKLLKDPRSPAIFQVEIDGLSTSLLLTCTMSKSANNWNLIRIHQDSVMKKH